MRVTCIELIKFSTTIIFVSKKKVFEADGFTKFCQKFF